MQSTELLDKYGPTMDVNDLAEFFEISKGSVYNKLSKDTLGVPVYKFSGRIRADTIDVVKFVNELKLSKK